MFGGVCIYSTTYEAPGPPSPGACGNQPPISGSQVFTVSLRKTTWSANQAVCRGHHTVVALILSHVSCGCSCPSRDCHLWPLSLLRIPRPLERHWILSKRRGEAGCLSGGWAPCLSPPSTVTGQLYLPILLESTVTK